MKLTKLRRMVTINKSRNVGEATMKKKFVVAVATTLIFANGSSIALASGGGGDSSTTSTTVPVNSRVTNTQRAAQQRATQQRAAQQAQNAAIAKYKAALTAIQLTFKTARDDAQKALVAAMKVATTGAERTAAAKAKNDAIIKATKARTAALRALVKPTKP